MTDGEFKSILLPCYRRMYASAFAILRNADDAADAVQDAITRLWSRHPDMDVPEAPQAYCCASVRRICIDRLRASDMRCAQVANAVFDAGTPQSSDADASYDSTMTYIRRVLERFPDKQRQVLTLSFISQLTYDEISHVMGLSPANVRQVISRGRLKLKDCLINESKR